MRETQAGFDVICKAAHVAEREFLRHPEIHDAMRVLVRWGFDPLDAPDDAIAWAHAWARCLRKHGVRIK